MVTFEAMLGVMVERCEKCLGVFLDAGEFDKMAHFHRIGKL